MKETATEIANRIGRLEMNRVSARVARSDAGQHVTVLRQRLTRNSSTQVQAQSSTTRVMEKVWQARSTFSRRPGAGHVAVHRPVGQEADERRKECSDGYSCHEGWLDQRFREGQQLHGHGEGLEGWSEDLLKELQVLDGFSDTESYELLDIACLRLEQDPSIDMQDEVQCGLVAVHLQDDTLKHNWN